jgi:hypothetical protein
LSSFVIALILVASSGWERVRADDKVTVERRELQGKYAGMYEVRVSTHASLPPERLFQTIWRSEDYPQFMSDIKEVRILESGPSSRLVYQRQRVPVVADRDYVVRVRYEHDEAANLFQVFVEGDSDAGPAPPDGVVRIRRTKAMWTLEPNAGGTDITYTVASEPGGAVPMWIVNSAQKSAAVDWVNKMIARSAQ